MIFFKDLSHYLLLFVNDEPLLDFFIPPVADNYRETKKTTNKKSQPLNLAIGIFFIIELNI